MDESIKENIIKVVAVIIIIVLLMFTISANVKYDLPEPKSIIFNFLSVGR